MDVTEFLLARVAEDEAVAKAAADTWDYYVNYDYGVDREHGERWSPAVVLAECEAKRRIVDEYRAALLERAEAWTVDDPRGSAGFEFEVALQFLALPYASHPDYRHEWAPEVRV